MQPLIPFADLRAARQQLNGELDAAVARVLDSGWYVLGPELEAFEREFAEYVGARNCVGVGSGLNALELALRAAGVGPGDEVIVPAYTWFATWVAVTNVGARPVGVDVEEATYNIDPLRIEEAITGRTRAILPVHLRGQPADMDGIAELAIAHDLRVIEDAAQAAGARYGGRRVGAIGDIGAFSFYPTKNLGGIGDGGAVTTDDDELAERVRRLRNYGLRDREELDVAGTNSRLGEVQAAVLRVLLPRLDGLNRDRAAIAQAYAVALGDRPEIRLPAVVERTDPVWHLFVIDHDERDQCRRALAAGEIETLVHYPVLPHQSGVYREQAPVVGFPVAERLAASALSLPVYPQLDPADQERVAYAVTAPLQMSVPA